MMFHDLSQPPSGDKQPKMAARPRGVVSPFAQSFTIIGCSCGLTEPRLRLQDMTEKLEGYSWLKLGAVGSASIPHMILTSSC